MTRKRGKRNKKAKMKKILFLFEREKSACYWCKIELSIDLVINNVDDSKLSNRDDYPTMDHVLPRSKGGNHSVNNLVLSCRWCNNNRGDKLINPKNNKEIHPEKIKKNLTDYHEEVTKKCGV